MPEPPQGARADAGQPGHGRDRDALSRLNVDQLQELAAQERIQGRSGMGKDELLDALANSRR